MIAESENVFTIYRNYLYNVADYKENGIEKSADGRAKGTQLNSSKGDNFEIP